MLFDKNGDIIRDIDIDSLEIHLDSRYCKSIILTKEKIVFQDNGNTDFSSKEIPITISQFSELSENIHNAGLLNIIQPKTIEIETDTDSDYKVLTCVFDDCSQYEFKTKDIVPKEYEIITEILLKYYTI